MALGTPSHQTCSIKVIEQGAHSREQPLRDDGVVTVPQQCQDAPRRKRDKDISGLLSGARLQLQKAAAQQQELEALKNSDAQKQQALDVLQDHVQQLEEAALVSKAKLASSQAAAGVDDIWLKQQLPRLVLEAAAVLAARQAAEAACKSCTPQKMHRPFRDQDTAQESFIPHTPGQTAGGHPAANPKADPQNASAAPNQAATGAALAVAPEPETALHQMLKTANVLTVQAAAAAAPLGARGGRSSAGNTLSRIMARWRGVRAAGTACGGTNTLYSAHTLWV